MPKSHPLFLRLLPQRLNGVINIFIKYTISLLCPAESTSHQPHPHWPCGDNQLQAAIKLAIDDNYHARTKHIDIRYHFIRQVVTDGTITLIYCSTDDMAADFLTKVLPKWKVSTHACTLYLHL